MGEDHRINNGDYVVLQVATGCEGNTAYIISGTVFSNLVQT